MSDTDDPAGSLAVAGSTATAGSIAVAGSVATAGSIATVVANMSMSLDAFVADGVESAVRQAAAVAGEKTVGIASPDIVRQCLDAGLLDAISVDLVPVLLGKGIRFFDHLAAFPVTLDDPHVVRGTRVTHLTYRVRKTASRAGDVDQPAVR